MAYVALVALLSKVLLKIQNASFKGNWKKMYLEQVSENKNN